MNTKMRTTKFGMIALIIALPVALMSFDMKSESANGPAFSLSSESSTVNWKGMKPGGEHYGIIEVVNGAIETDGSTVTGGSFTIDMNSIICEDLSNETYNQKLVGHLKSADFFHTEEYPEAYFTITKVQKQMSAKDGFSANHLVTGDLTIRGNKKEISFPANIKMDENMVYAKTGEIVLDRTEWDVNYQSKKIFANLKDSYINDEMIVSLDLSFDRK